MCLNDTSFICPDLFHLFHCFGDVSFSSQPLAASAVRGSCLLHHCESALPARCGSRATRHSPLSDAGCFCSRSVSPSSLGWSTVSSLCAKCPIPPVGIYLYYAMSLATIPGQADRYAGTSTSPRRVTPGAFRLPA